VEHGVLVQEFLPLPQLVVVGVALGVTVAMVMEQGVEEVPAEET
jgi:hypothetical protein